MSKWQQSLDDQIEPTDAYEPGQVFDTKEIDWDLFEPYFERLPGYWRDIFLLRHKEGMTQIQVAKLFNVTQSAISFTEQKIIRALKWLRAQPPLERDEFDRDFVLWPMQQRAWMWALWWTTSQSCVGRIWGMSQGQIHHFYLQYSKRILFAAQLDDRYVKYQTAMTNLHKHWMVLQHTVMPGQSNPTLMHNQHLTRHDFEIEFRDEKRKKRRALDYIPLAGKRIMRPLTPEERAKVKTFIINGRSHRSIAREMHICGHTIRKIRSEMDIEPATCNRKLTPEEVMSLRSKKAQGALCIDLVREFGVSLSTVSRIVNGRTHREK